MTHDPLDAAAIADRLGHPRGREGGATGIFEEVTARPRTGYVAELMGLTCSGAVLPEPAWCWTTGRRW